MRKNIFIISFLLVAVLIVSACSPAASTAPAAIGTEGVPAVPTTGVETVSVPETGSTPLATGDATGAATSEATVDPSAGTTAAPTTAVTAAATSAATSAATTEATTETTGTPDAAASTPLATQTTAAGTGTDSTPQAGAANQLIRLSTLLQSNLVTGSETGDISGVVITQPQPTANVATPDAASAAVDVPYIRYVVVNTGGSSGEQLLPWQMFSFDPVTSTPTGVSQNFTLNGTADARSNAPRVSLPAETGILATGFDSQLSQYWAGQGFSVPVTGATEQDPGTQVLLRETLNGTNIVTGSDQALGQVADFLINPTTGAFAYAVFNTGPDLGSRQFVVPVQNLNFQLDSATAAGLGNIQLDITPELLLGAPAISDLNQLQLDPTLLQQLNDFWKAFPNSQ